MARQISMKLFYVLIAAASLRATPIYSIPIAGQTSSYYPGSQLGYSVNGLNVACEAWQAICNLEPSFQGMNYFQSATVQMQLDQPCVPFVVIGKWGNIYQRSCEEPGYGQLDPIILRTPLTPTGPPSGPPTIPPVVPPGEPPILPPPGEPPIHLPEAGFYAESLATLAFCMAVWSYARIRQRRPS